MGLNAQTSVPAFTAGQVLTAQQQTDINTGIPVFATTVTRDAAFGGTGEKTLAQGQYAYIEATSTLQVYSGSAWINAGGGLTLVSAQTIGNAVGSVTVSNCFSATYDVYKIIVSGGVGSVTNNNFNMTLGASVTGYNYSFIYNSYNATTASEGATNAAAWIDLGGIDLTSLNLNMEINGPFLAKSTTFSSSLARPNIAGTTNGIHTVATSFTGFTITATGGTITGGGIRVYGYQLN